MKVAFCRKAEKMTELEYICPLAHCVNLTWYAGGLLYFAGKESDRVTLYYTHLGGKPDMPRRMQSITQVFALPDRRP